MEQAYNETRPNVVIEVKDATVRFNMASEKIDNLKEYMVKALKRELMFKEFLALDNVSFEIRKGEAWGLVGVNGAGKSTLLKLICGILSPYKGSVWHTGSIAPMIELGAGFDSNLTAAENIFLNGALLGHSKAFMQSYYDEIVEFAELEKFMDMPIKNYSSGMRARLGFAVATIVKPDILIVDEVLAVGDAAFQKKCMRRMEDLLSAGTTLVFVSHSISAVRKLCDHVLWLDHGKMKMCGTAEEICDAYETACTGTKPIKKKQGTTPYDYVVVGSGLSGAVFANEMKWRGKKVLVLEKRSHIGGNVYTEEIEGIQIHKYGPHIFHTNNKEVWEYMGQFTKFNGFVNSPLANYKGKIYNLPFNMNTFAQMWAISNPREAQAIIESQQGTVKEEPQNLEEQAIRMVGRDIYEKLIKGYTEKQWGRPCDQLPPEIIQRLPVRYTYNNNYFADAYQGIPAAGYTAAVEQMLQGCDVLLNTDYLQDKAHWDAQAEKVVYTGALDAYFGYSLGHLAYRSLRFEEAVLEEENYQGVAVMNYTDREVPYTRVIEHKHFHPGAKKKAALVCEDAEAEEPEEEEKTVITYEYPEKWEPGKEAYYPINDAENEALAEQYRALADKEENVLFLGRLGTYRYLDMDAAVLCALEAAKQDK